MNKIYELVADDNFHAKRVDQFLSETIEELTRSNIKNFLVRLSVNGINQKLSYKLRTGDKVLLEIKPEIKGEIPIAEDIPLDIIYSDINYIVINKAPGMVVHPAKGNYTGTMVNALLGTDLIDEEKLDEERPGIVHRLDKDTSGLIIVARNFMAHSYLSELFKDRKITKKYKAIVKGFVNPVEITIENHIGRSSVNRKKMSVVDNGGKEAVTKLKVIKRNQIVSLLDVEIFTGRTHQIRVHLSHLGFPVVGDKLYSRKDSRFGDVGMCLVSYYLSFFDKFSDKHLEFMIDMPEYMIKMVDSFL